MQIRVLLAASNEAVLASLRTVLSSDHDLNIVGEARSVTTILQLVAGCIPDVLILDSKIDVPNGLAVVGELRQQCPSARTVMLVTPDDSISLLDLPTEQLSGCVRDDADAGEIVTAVRKIAEGHKVWDADLVRQAVCTSARPAPLFPMLARTQGRHKPVVAARQAPVLSPRELAVLSLVSRGLNNQKVGENLGIRTGTVRRHLASVYEKLGVHTRTEAVTRAIQSGSLQLSVLAPRANPASVGLRNEGPPSPEPDPDWAARLI